MRIELFLCKNLHKKDKATLSANSILFRSHASTSKITPLFPDSYVIFTSPIEIFSFPLAKSNFKDGLFVGVVLVQIILVAQRTLIK